MEYWKFYSKSDYIKIAPSYSTDLIAVFIQSQIYLPRRQKYAFTTFYSCPVSLQSPHNSASGLDVIHSCATAKLLCKFQPTILVRATRTWIQCQYHGIKFYSLHCGVGQKRSYWFLLVLKSVCKILTSLKVMEFYHWLQSDLNICRHKLILNLFLSFVGLNAIYL